MVGKDRQAPKYVTGGGVFRTAKDDAPIKRPSPCPWLCNLVPVDVPNPGAAQTVLHPRKDVFVLKVPTKALSPRRGALRGQIKYFHTLSHASCSYYFFGCASCRSTHRTTHRVFLDKSETLSHAS